MRDDITLNMAGLFNNNGVAEKMQDLRNRQTDRQMDGQSLLQRFIVAYQNKDLRSQQHITKYKMPEN